MDTFTHFEDELAAAIAIYGDFPILCVETISDSEEEEQEQKQQEEEQEEEIATEYSFFHSRIR